MPELPDLTVYIEALQGRIVGARLEQIVINNPFLLRTALPPLASAAGRLVTQLRRIGKRIVIGLEGELWLVVHLMLAGRDGLTSADLELPEAEQVVAVGGPPVG